MSIAVLQSRKYAKRDARRNVHTNSLEDVVGHITCARHHILREQTRERCPCDLERMVRRVVRGVGDVDEHSMSEGFDEG